MVQEARTSNETPFPLRPIFRERISRSSSPPNCKRGGLRTPSGTGAPVPGHSKGTGPVLRGTFSFKDFKKDTIKRTPSSGEREIRGAGLPAFRERAGTVAEAFGSGVARPINAPAIRQATPSVRTGRMKFRSLFTFQSGFQGPDVSHRWFMPPPTSPALEAWPCPWRSRLPSSRSSN